MSHVKWSIKDDRSRLLELQTAKEILAEIVHASALQCEEMIQERRAGERIVGLRRKTIAEKFRLGE